MRDIVGVLDVRQRDVRISLRCGQRRMTQAIPNRHDVGAVLQHVCRCAVSERVRVYSLHASQRAPFADRSWYRSLIDSDVPL
jgi:hypothetical protein